MKTRFFLLIVITMLSASVNAQIGGHALKFDGTDDYISVPDNTTLDFTEFTVEMWVYKTISSKNIKFMGQAVPNSAEKGWSIGISDNNTVFAEVINSQYNHQWTQINNGTIPTNAWTHIAMTWKNNDKLILYINGKKIEEKVSGNWDIKTTYNLIIGKAPWYNLNENHFEGKLDEIRLWNVVRTEAEIKANMYKELAGSETNLVAYYKMDGSGSILTDFTSNTNDGTLQNSPTWKASGAFAGSKQALDFDGIDDYINFSTYPAYNNSSLTLEAWIKSTDSGNEKEIISWGGKATEFRMDGGKLQFGIDVDGWSDVKGTTNINSGNWTHVAVVKSNTNIKLYVNGVLDASGVINDNPTVNINSFQIAHMPNNNNNSRYQFPGQIDEVRIWHSERTEAEIHENMMKTLVGNETNLVAYYRFDHYDGNTLYDMTANGHNGTLTNMDPATDWTASTAFNTWIGGESSTWNTAANWSNGVPSASDNVGVYKWTEGYELNVNSTVNTGSMLVSATANPTFDAAINTTGAFIPLRNVNLKFTTNNAIGIINNPTGNELIVPADAKVTVSTAIDNSGKIILKSDDTNSAQIKNNGSAPTPGTVILRKDLKAASGWYFISFPFDVTLSNIKKTSTQATVTVGDYRTATGPTYDDLYIIEYNGTRRDQTGTATATNSPNWDAVTSGTLSAKKGYAIRVMSDIEIDFIGTSNADMFANTDKSATVGDYHTNASAIHHGWNLVGIPFTTAFDIANLGSGTYFYIYDKNTQTYIVKEKNVDTYQLDAFGAFFMQASATSLTFANAGRALKAPSVVETPAYSKIDLAISNGTFTDNTQIRLMEGATNTYELNKDAAKMLSMNSSVPQLWSKAETFDVAINALPENTQEVKLGLRIGTTGNYTMKLNAISPNQTAILVDNLNGNRTNLNEKSSYTFNVSNISTISDRFKIVTGTDVNTAVLAKPNELISAAIVNGHLILRGLEEKSTVKVFDTKSVLLGTFTNVENTQALKLNITTNLLIVTVENNKSLHTFKLYSNN